MALKDCELDPSRRIWEYDGNGTRVWKGQWTKQYIEDDMTRDNIFILLKDNTAVVTFTKVTGEERIMRCTLREDIIPSVEEDGLQQAGFTPNKPVNEKALPVWDIENNGWRSFRIDSIKSIVLE